MNLKLPALLICSLMLTGCIASPVRPERPLPMRLDELAALATESLSDDELIARIERGGVAFVLTSADMDRLRAEGLSDGVLRYLQGRASGEQALRDKIVRGRYRLPSYTGYVYLGRPYLGYYDGFHYYGFDSHSSVGYLGWGASRQYHHAFSHSASHGGGHAGGGHRGGHH